MKKKKQRKKLLEILDNFPYLKIKYNKNKKLKNFDFSALSEYNNYDKLIVLYSIIQDSTEFIKDFKEDDLDILFDYNEKQKDDHLYSPKIF